MPIRTVGSMLEELEQLHNGGHTTQEIIEVIGVFGGNTWWAQGVCAFHDGVEHGVAGTAWTRADAERWNKGWEAAAKHSGLRKVVFADCGPDDMNCTDCNQEQGDWHYMGCTKLEVAP